MIYYRLRQHYYKYSMVEYLNQISKKYAYLLVLLIVVLQAITVVFIKYAAMSIADDVSLMSIVLNIFYIISMCLFVLRTLLWQVLLLQNSIAKYYPMLSLNYIVLLVFSYFIFSEEIYFSNILGTIIIIYGVYKLSHK